MKKLSLFVVLITVLSLSAFGQWEKDVLGEGFEQMILQMPDDYEGEVVSVLVRSLPKEASNRAVLYVHGFNDYFFHVEQAQQYNKHGYAFFAVDLRKYGRSYRSHQKMGNVKSLTEYYADIDTCLRIIRAEGYDTIILAAHSTGGLISVLYADDHKGSLPVQRIVLNSPFLDMNFTKGKEKIGVPIVSGLGAIMPGVKLKSGNNSLYAESLHKNYKGEWDYDLEWKPAMSIPVSFGWTRAIHKGHKKIKKGLDIPVPILVMHSDKSVYGDEWSEDFTKSDAVLDVNDIHKYATNLGKDVTIVTIQDGVHDLVLSREDVRVVVYKTIFDWLEKEGF